MSLYALKRLGLDQIWWLVSPQNPLKPSTDMAPMAERMVWATKVANDPRIIVTALEQDLGTRYTIDTLRALKMHYPHTRFVWLMGADNLQQIPRWRRWMDIFKTMPVAVFRRPGYVAGYGVGKAAQFFRRSWLKNERDLSKSSGPAWRVIDNPLNSLSATNLRKEQATWQRKRKR